MPTLAWIVTAGVAMSLIALVGMAVVALPEARFAALVRPLVALAAGSLLGGAAFHLLPEAVEAMDGLGPWSWFVGGFGAFFLLEQLLHWHHCHRGVSEHRPLGSMLLVADGLHNLIGGLAVGAAFIADTRLGIVTWLAAAAHEVPQELGDFGILVHSGWKRRSALVYNVLSASTFSIGGLVAYAVSGDVDVEFLVPFAAGNFVYIAAADLLPEIRSEPSAPRQLLTNAMFALGLGVLLLVALLGEH